MSVMGFMFCLICSKHGFVVNRAVNDCPHCITESMIKREMQKGPVYGHFC